MLASWRKRYGNTQFVSILNCYRHVVNTRAPWYARRLRMEYPELRKHFDRIDRVAKRAQKEGII